MAELVDAKNCNEVCPTFTLNKKGINAEVRKQLQVRILVLTIFLTIKTNNMNAKEQVIQELKEKILNTIRFGNENYIQQLERLIAATEAAIFELPSQEEIEQKLGFSSRESDIFLAGINFILTYKKPEPDGK